MIECSLLLSDKSPSEGNHEFSVEDFGK